MEYLGWLYLATRLDTISMWFGWLTAISAAMVVITTIVILISYDMTYERGEDAVAKREAFRGKLRPWRKWGIALFLVFGSLVSLTPTKKDAMIIAGGVGVIEATKAVAGSDIAKTSVKIIEKWLQEQLNDGPKKAEPTPEKKADEKKAESKSGTGDKVKEIVSGAVDGAVDGALKSVKK
jgi:hypothetical protein